jgi:hypothetical protein
LKPTTLTMYFYHILWWKENQGRSIASPWVIGVFLYR